MYSGPFRWVTVTATDTTRRDVLVLDADGQAGLCVVRSLGRHGVPVTAASEHRFPIGALSKYAADSLAYPPPVERPDAFVDTLVDHLTDREYFAVLPISDATTAVVSRYKQTIEETGVVVGAADWEQFHRTYDKRETFALAADLDVPTPETHAPDSLADVEAIASDIRYPVVVKSRSKHVWDDDDRLVQHRVGTDDYARSSDELVSVYRRLLNDEALRETPPLVQEYVDGRTTTVVGVAADGDLLSEFQELRLRTTPASGGNSTLIRGTRQPSMRAYAAEVVDALDWTGPVQVEFMWTDDDEFYLIEVNGRYWGSTPLAVASGVDIPWHHYCLLAGYPQPQPATYRDDVVQQRLLYGDLKWLAEQLDDGNLAALWPFFTAFLTAQQVFVSTNDPLPTIGSVVEAASLGARKFGLLPGEAEADANN